jgi:hypothetical protein
MPRATSAPDRVLPCRGWCGSADCLFGLEGALARFWGLIRPGRKLYLSFVLNSILQVRFIKIVIIYIIFGLMMVRALPKHGED